MLRASPDSLSSWRDEFPILGRTLYMISNSLGAMPRVGVDRVREKSIRMTAHLLDLVDRRGWATSTSRDPERVAGTVAIDVPEALPASRGLKARDLLVDYRPRVGIRVSPHFYNTFDELDRLVQTLEDVLASKDLGGGSSSRVT